MPEATRPPSKHRRKLLRFFLLLGCIATLAAGIAFVTICFLTLHDHKSFLGLIAEADSAMQQVGGGVTHGRRSAERHVFVWVHDTNLTASSMHPIALVLRGLDQDPRVELIRLELIRAKIADDALDCLSNVTKLVEVDLPETGMTAEGIARLRKSVSPTATIRHIEQIGSPNRDSANEPPR
jgi:hypothetical protein